MRTVIPLIVDLAVQIVRFVNDHQPGVVECEFTDATGRRHIIIDKVPIFTCEILDAGSKYPRPGKARCMVLNRSRDARGRELVSISSAHPDGIESNQGLSQFIVVNDQVSASVGDKA